MAITVTASEPGSGAAATPAGLPFVVAAASVGALIAWYGFYLYGGLAVLFATLFFPAGNPTLSLLASLAAFGAGFVARPLGAALFGHLGDRIGRKFALVLSLASMGTATVLIGCLPTYAAAGTVAPLLLVLLRLGQGLALGGAYGSAAIYVAEHAPDGKRGFYTAWVQVTATAGIVLSLLVILACRLGLGDESFRSYGWRLPFLLSAVLVALAVYVRLKLRESPIFARLKAQGRTAATPLKESFARKSNLSLMLAALLGATAPEGVVWFCGQYYALYFMQAVLKVGDATVYGVVIVALCLAAPFTLVFGHLSDRFGRHNIMTAGFVLAVITYLPAFKAMAASADRPAVLTILVFYLAVLVAMVYGPLAAFLVELFPARVRSTSVSVAYQIGNGVFGGLVPLIGAALVAGGGNIYLGLAFPIAIAALGAVVNLVWLREPTHQVRIWDEAGERPPPPAPYQP